VGSWTAPSDEKAGGEVIGGALRTRTEVEPVYVCEANRIPLESALRFTLAVSDGRRTPRSARDADHPAGETKRKVVGGIK